MCDDDTFRLCWFPADEVTFHDTWYSAGLRGTGSLDFSVDGVVVPAHRTYEPLKAASVVDAPLGSFPNFTLLAACISAVSLGIARRAVDELVAMAEGKRPAVLVEVARPERVRADRAVESRGRRGDRRGRSSTTRSASAGSACSPATGSTLPTGWASASPRTNAASTAAEVADRMFTLAGGSSVYTSNVLQRCMRDAHIPTQHLQVAPKLHETLGRILLGQDADTRML